MPPEPVPRSLLAAGASALEVAGTADGKITVLDLDRSPSAFTAGWATVHPERYRSVSAVGAGEAVETAAGLAAADTPVFLAGSAERLAVEGFSALRRTVAQPRRNVKVVVTDGGWSPSAPAVLEDVALLRGLPGISLVVPADAASAADAVRSVATMEGPAYLRLSPEAPAPLGEIPLVPGRARELRSGSDLALLALGPAMHLAVEAAAQLARSGLSVRVLDLAWLRPVDEKAILRAARDCGALLTLEENQAATGIGTLVAALTAENTPVPVRRLGSPDLFGPAGAPAEGRSSLGLTAQTAVDEAWELLRLKGKVQ